MHGASGAGGGDCFAHRIFTCTAPYHPCRMARAGADENRPNADGDDFNGPEAKTEKAHW
jgi:hypothetical protein